MMTAAEIDDLCNKWHASMAAPQGGVNIDPREIEKHRLLTNGVVFHELPLDALCASIAGTAKALLHPGLYSVYQTDHYLLWAWCGDLILNPHPNYRLFPPEQFEVQNLFRSAVHAALSGRESRANLVAGHHTAELAALGHTILIYLAFPMLEASLRRACSNYVDLNGVVVQEFHAPRRNGTKRPYPRGSSCNDISHLLQLFLDTSPAGPVSFYASRFCEHLLTLDPKYQYASHMVGEWRNEHLHGTADFRAIGGSILSLAFLVALSLIADRFDETRERTATSSLFHYKNGKKPGWQFYPVS